MGRKKIGKRRLLGSRPWAMAFMLGLAILFPILFYKRVISDFNPQDTDAFNEPELCTFSRCPL